MALIGDREREQVQEILKDSLDGSVKMVMFTQSMECGFCAETRQLVEELASLSEQLEAEVYDFVNDGSMAEQYGVDKIPAIALVGEKDYGIRFYGIPSGYEFTTLVEGIIHASNGDSALTDETRAAVAGVSTPVHLQVFVTPT